MVFLAPTLKRGLTKLTSIFNDCFECTFAVEMISIKRRFYGSHHFPDFVIEEWILENIKIGGLQESVHSISCNTNSWPQKYKIKTKIYLMVWDVKCGYVTTLKKIKGITNALATSVLVITQWNTRIYVGTFGSIHSDRLVCWIENRALT